MRSPPTSTYCGLTIILDAPSRFDREHLLTGLAGGFVEEEAIKPYKLSNCDVRTYDERNTPYVTGTKAVCWMGANIATPCGTVPFGYITSTGSIRHAQTWSPQDCMDPKNYEYRDEENEEDDFTDLDTKASYPTRRTNYRYWTAQIIQKLIHEHHQAYSPIRIEAAPNLKKVVSTLNNTRDEDIYLDIETSPAKRGIQCIGVSTTRDFPRVFVVPVYDYSGRRFYPILDFLHFHRALSIAFQRNTVVIHNSHFDLAILHAWYKCHLPISVYDTMLAGHRCYPEAEKSLSHNLVRWTELSYHKISSVETFNSQQQRTMWEYNARDVYALKYIKDAQLGYARTIPGLLSSINQVNDSIIPYLEMTLLGLPVDRAAQLVTEQKLKATKIQYERICRILTGISDLNPGSTKQLAGYLHKQLAYPVVGRTETGAPKLGRKQFYQLLLKHKNPALNAILAYKKVAKDLSMLAFELWSTPTAPVVAPHNPFPVFHRH